MERIKIVLPEKAIFETELKIRIGDINYGGHLANEKVLPKCSDLRLEFLSKHNFDELNVGNCGLIIADAAIQYKAEGRYGDVLNSKLFVDKISKRSFVFKYEFKRIADQKTIAIAQTTHLYFNYQENKLTSAPDEFLKLLQST